MAFLKNAAKFLLSPALALAGVGGKRATPTVAPLPGVTRDDAAAMAAQDDELRRRKGGMADILTGRTGAEAALTGGKLILGN